MIALQFNHPLLEFVLGKKQHRRKYMANLNVNGQLGFNLLSSQAQHVLLDFIYPVGSIYLAIDNSKSPEILFGGTWQQLESGYALWCTNAGNGTKISAGLPNITGRFLAYSWETGAGTGAFYSNIDNPNTVGGNNSNRNWCAFNFDASRSSNIYGGSTTVQPPAISICAWKRVS